MLRLAGDTDSFLITDDAGESTLNKVAAQAEAAARKNAAAALTGRVLARISGSSSYRCMSASSGIESPMAMKVA
jgi:sarcosine oxidase gamma subunit